MAGSAIIGTLRAILTLDTAEFETASKQVSQSAKAWTKDLRSMGSQATAIGSSLTKVLTVPILGIGYAAVEAGAQFEQTMNQVGAVTNASAGDMKKLSDAATEWGAKTKFSNTEAAEAMLELGKAGFTADQTIAALPTTLQLATAANMGLGEAAQMTANVMNTFGLAAGDLAHSNDIMAEAANRSTIDVADLRESLKFVGPVAHIAGVSLADVAAASAVLGQNGIKAEMAGTGLRGMLASLLSPSKDLKGMLTDIGFAAEVTAGKTVNWTAMLDALHQKFGEGKESADKYAGWIMDAFGKRAGPAVIAMAQEGGTAIAGLSAQLDASSGSAARMTDAFMKGLPGAIEVAKGSMETMFASIETTLAPTLEKLLGLVADVAGFVANTLVPAFNALPEPVKMAAVVFAGVAAAIGPVIFIVGQLLTAMATITAAFTTTGIATTALTALMPALGTAFTILTGPIGIAAAAIAALGLAWYTWGDDVTRIVKEVYAAVKEWLWDKLEPVLTPLIALVDSVGKMFEAFGKLVGAVVEKTYAIAKEFLLDKLGAAFESLKAIVQTVVEFIGKWIGKIPDALLPLLGPIGAVVLAFRHWDEIATIAKAVYTGIKTWLLDKFTDIVNSIKGKVDAVTGFFKDMYDKVVGHSYVPDMVRKIGEEFVKLDALMVRPASKAAAAVSKAFQDATSTVFLEMAKMVSAAQGGMAGIAAYANDFAMNFVAGFADVFLPGLGSVIKAAWPIIMDGLKAIGNAIKSFFGWVWGGIKSLFGGGTSEPAPTAPDGYIPPATGYREDGTIDPYGPYYSQLRGSMSDAEWANFVANGGLNVPGFATGTGGQYLDFGSGTLAMLHGREMITPEGAAMDAGSWGGGATSFTGKVFMEGRLVGRALFEPIVREAARHQVTQLS